MSQAAPNAASVADASSPAAGDSKQGVTSNSTGATSTATDDANVPILTASVRRSSKEVAPVSLDLKKSECAGL